jgi:hypothetical protein
MTTGYRRRWALCSAFVATGMLTGYVLVEDKNLPGVVVKWPMTTITYCINPTGSGLPVDQTILAIQNAFASWSQADKALNFQYLGTTSTKANATDHQNTIFWDTDHTVISTSAKELGLTILTPDNGGNIVDVDIAFSTTTGSSVLVPPSVCSITGIPAIHLFGVPLVWTIGTQGLGGIPFISSVYNADIQATATHEIGHLLGLAHTQVSNAVMSIMATTPAFFCNTDQRNLKTDDIAGVTFLYPPPSTAPTHFVVTSNMTTPRDGHSATLLHNGDVLIVGGSYVENLASAELYNPTAGTFAATGSMHLARSGHTVTLLADGRVLIAGGNGGGASAEIYDPSSGTFALTGNMTMPRENHVAALLNNGKVLVAGGFNGTLEQASAELYDPTTGTFTATGSMMIFRESPTATTLLNGNVLVAGGFFNPGGADSSIATAEVFNAATGAFTPTGSMTSRRVSQTATLLANGEVLIVGGNDFTGGGRGDNLASAELYNPTTGTFMPTGSMSAAREQHTATALPNGSILVVGGFDFGVGSLGTTEIFNPSANSFAAGPYLNIRRYNQTATRLATGAVLIAGGDNSGGAGGVLASAELSQ